MPGIANPVRKMHVAEGVVTDLKKKILFCDRIKLPSKICFYPWINAVLAFIIEALICSVWQLLQLVTVWRSVCVVLNHSWNIYIPHLQSSSLSRRLRTAHQANL